MKGVYSHPDPGWGGRGGAVVMMTKEKGSDGKREGQRGRSDPEKESGLLRFLPVAAAASQNQNNHKMCLIFGVICGEEAKMPLKRTHANDLFLYYALTQSCFLLLFSTANEKKASE